MSKHTPGPWVKSQYGELKNPEGNDIYVWGLGVAHGNRTQESEANARLISAAPEMLDALKAARDLWGDYLPPGNSNAMKAMKLVNAAIAKVTT